MRPGERKPYRAVVKSRRLPRRRVVAGLAGLRESQRHVIGIRGLLIVGQVTAHAVGRCALKSSPGMAGIAVQCGVGAYKANPVNLRWSNLAPSQLFMLWHCSQLVGKRLPTWLGWAV